MKIAITSGIHSNLAVLRSPREDHGERWGIGEPVNASQTLSKFAVWVCARAHSGIPGNPNEATGVSRDCGRPVACKAMKAGNRVYPADTLSSLSKIMGVKRTKEAL